MQEVRVRRRLVNMHSARGRWPQFLSVTVLATVLLCQVVGALCPSVLPVLGATKAIRSVHAWHEMEGMDMCQDSIPSSLSSFKWLESSSSSLSDSAPSVPHGLQAVRTNHSAGPPVPVKGHSILSRLSTFRI